MSSHPTLLEIKIPNTNDFVDYTDIIAYDGYSHSFEGLQADGSGRNPLSGNMWFRTLKIPNYLDIIIANCADPARVSEFLKTIWGNHQINVYRYWNVKENELRTMTAYVNKTNIGMFNTYYRLGKRINKLKSFPIHITEM